MTEIIDELENALAVNTDPPGANELSKSESGMVINTFSDIVGSVMDEAQFAILQGRTPKRYIKKRPGKGGKTFSYVPHGYVTAVLNKAFGFNWDFEMKPVDGSGKMFLHIQGGVSGAKQNDSIIVYGVLTVRIRIPDTRETVTITKGSTGEKEMVKGMSWGGLIKSAESDAFKKAASRLGIALDLYWQDADTDYIPEETLSPQMQSLVDAIKATDNWQTAAPPVLAQMLEVDIPTIAKALKAIADGK